MASLFIDYQQAVMADYRRRKAVLSLNLAMPTPARLKEQCERVCNERFIIKDEKTIRDFFAAGGGKKACLQAIGLCKPDRFKPLINFLNKETAKTDEKNIELLAWLIDFPRRPFDDREDYTVLMVVNAGYIPEDVNTEGSKEDAEESTLSIEEFQGTVVHPIDDAFKRAYSNEGGQAQTAEKFEMPVSDNVRDEGRDIAGGFNDNAVKGDSGPKSPSRKVVVVGLLVFVLGGGAYWWKDNNMPLGSATGTGGCMYWKEDHYEAVPCNQKMAKTLVVALDEVKLRDFKKITREDTITFSSIGKIWYLKSRGNIEYFTSNGTHPIEITREVHPITEHIIRVHILSKGSIQQASLKE